jgi:hypothetical protein
MPFLTARPRIFPSTRKDLPHGILSPRNARLDRDDRKRELWLKIGLLVRGFTCLFLLSDFSLSLDILTM